MQQVREEWCQPVHEGVRSTTDWPKRQQPKIWIRYRSIHIKGVHRYLVTYSNYANIKVGTEGTESLNRGPGQTKTVHL